MILIKAIKPKKLRVDKMRLELLTEMNAIGSDIQKDFEKTTKTWDHKVKFEIVKSIPTNLGRVEIFVGTNDRIYQYVDEGTREHIIQPKGDYPLEFRSRYKRKTTPNVIGSKQGGAFGEKRYAYWVIHPGNKPANLSETIAKTWQKRMKRRMEKAMRRAVQASGHAI